MIGVVGRAASANAAKLVPRPEEGGFLFGEESSRWKKEEGKGGNGTKTKLDP